MEVYAMHSTTDLTALELPSSASFMHAFVQSC